jgi:hypothetical protein
MTSPELKALLDKMVQAEGKGAVSLKMLSEFSRVRTDGAKPNEFEQSLIDLLYQLNTLMHEQGDSEEQSKKISKEKGSLAREI